MLTNCVSCHPPISANVIQFAYLASRLMIPFLPLKMAFFGGEKRGVTDELSRNRECHKRKWRCHRAKCECHRQKSKCHNPKPRCHKTGGSVNACFLARDQAGFDPDTGQNSRYWDKTPVLQDRLLSHIRDIKKPVLQSLESRPQHRLFCVWKNSRLYGLP